MKKSKKIEILQTDDEHLYKLLRELMDENEALFTALFKIGEITKAAHKFPLNVTLATGEVVRPGTPGFSTIGGNALDHLAVYTGEKWVELDVKEDGKE